MEVSSKVKCESADNKLPDSANLGHNSIKSDTNLSRNISFIKAQASIRENIRNILKEYLENKNYSHDSIGKWIGPITDSIKYKIKDLGFNFCKIIVDVSIGERIGQGVQTGIRCLWDTQTDNYISEIYSNESLYCLVVVVLCKCDY